MGRLSLICLILLVGAAAAPQQASAQAGTPPPAQTPAPPAAAPPTAADDTSRSLFALTDREFFIGGRVSSIDGDPARFQRYQDLRDGLLFSGFRYAFAQPDGASTFNVRANNVGWRDQEYFANYNRAGKLSLTGSYQQIPQFYSVDTMTPYTGSGGTLVLDDAAQRAAQGGAGLNPYPPIAPRFDLLERRDIGRVDVVATPTPKLDVTANFTTQKHGGELPWGASFGFSNDVEVPLPYDSRANDFTIGTEWTNAKNMLRVAYSGSWFDNLTDPLVWDSPLRLDDVSGTPGRGRMSLWPSNSAQTISFGGYTKLAHRTQVTGFFSYGVWSNNEPLQPFTINSALAPIALPRTNADAEAHVFSTNLNLASHPTTDWRFGARFRNYTYSNHMPATSITNYVAYDSNASTTPTGGPDLYAHDRTTLDADATWSKLNPLALTVGYTHNGSGYDARILQSSGEDVFRVSADAVGSSWTTFRVQYEVGSRTGSGLDEKALTDIGEHPEMRHYDVADRTRNRFTGQIDIVPSDVWMFSVSGGILNDDYSNTFFGLQESSGRTFSLAADYHQPNGMGAGATYNLERYAGLQQSHEGDSSTAQFNDPLRNWTADSTETVHYFSIYATPPRIGRDTEVRFSYDFSHAEGNYLYTIPAGSPIPAPNQLPNVFNKLQQLHIDARHRIKNNLMATFSYLYEPLSIYDFAFDPSVVNGIVQPSSLVMGYVYRPYTANSFTFGLRYLW
ncbi:MAG: MtrB/PioB family outer membrane beta-barrel protein [Vicinamibacterales bacterium]|nr:MtrB/PioB family outer membrane beta-barrel protein [Vicinamibacterales bacterium]